MLVDIRFAGFDRAQVEVDDPFALAPIDFGDVGAHDGNAAAARRDQFGEFVARAGIARDREDVVLGARGVT